MLHTGDFLVIMVESFVVAGGHRTGRGHINCVAWRRRTQNRFAQRAYRQRKEQAIKDQEGELEDLKPQLAKEKKLNQALSKVVDLVKERLKTKPPSTAATC